MTIPTKIAQAIINAA